MPIRLTEPQPTTTTRMTFGRGGAGNHTRQPPPSSLSTSARVTETAPKINSSPPSHIASGQRFSTGRGGLGNMHPGTDEPPMFRFDEELQREHLQSERAPVYHVGRGGQGNAVNERRRSSGSEGSGSGSEKSSTRGSVEWVRSLAKKL